ncbi:cystathionine gamma-synthase [Rubrobacter xylanophilus DSM 9941]|uniref:homocysteine desulfhydrase n=1 Tax=Rubrobacter xylanophilus (strain DSM 9941 / JCM 11954 / NBRC 16129 / PRD-1) TaxID=266117 RepID=Q1AT24_RUBXD|nr:PLP-dependent aspartate aminotransferase family protein [Rubrobacter xylanophilus]ABG05454.1 cystathionine gamma-synthase [Rubrobacter xylanophilus DSM 9941]
MASGGEEQRRFETRAVHAGESRPGAGGDRGGDGFYPISTPIYASTTFSHADAQTTDRVLGGEEPGYSYARWGNPSVAALEEALTALEAPQGGARALAFASGMAAMHAALTAAELGEGARVLAADQLYGSTATLLLQIFGPAGTEASFFDAYDPGEAEKKVSSLRPRAVVVETISNPLLRVADIPRLAEISRSHGAALIVDNTFGTPYLQRPLELGADMVVHSATKYLSGHGDVTAGVVAAGPPYDAALEQIRKTVGSTLGPFEAWLLHRGLKTLPLRISRQCANARRIAAWLAEHPKVFRVHHPSLEGHPDREATGRLLADTGGLVAFELAAEGREAAFRFLNALRLCVRAPSLGDIYTLAIHPATSSHRELPPSRREQLGVRENLIRLSAGIEHPEDIIADLEQALERL